MKKYGRRLTQVVTAVLYNCNITGFAEGKIYKGNTKQACVPGLNCYSCPGAIGSCPIGSLQSQLVASKLRFPYYVLGLMLLFGILLGRFICGFMCPFGLIQELLYKIPTPKLKKNSATTILSYLKYVILIVFVVLIPIIFHLPGFCKYICPAGTLEGGIVIGLLDHSIRKLFGKLFAWKLGVLIIILISSVFCFRVFCRFICPLGAFYSLFNRVALFKMVVDEHKCVNCGACKSFCKMDIGKVGDRECIQCGECREVCHACAIYRETVINRQNIMEDNSKEQI